MSSEAVYLDHNATTPVAEPVLAAMLPFLREAFGNAASTQHVFGRQAAHGVDIARQQLAGLIGARPGEIAFTSGATEANNLALKGAVETAPPGRRRVIVSATEHRAVLDTAESLRSSGTVVDVAPVDADGVIDLAAFEALLGPDVVLVSVMAANNETGVLQPVREVAALARQAGALVHSDATQMVGRLPVDVDVLDVDLLSLSAHKMYGPKGTGALFVRRGTPLAAQIHGGGHERGLRSGTLNVPGIVGLSAAAALAAKDMDERNRADAASSAALVSRLRLSVGDLQEVGAAAPRLPGTRCVRFAGADAEAVMANSPGVACSTGSACTRQIPEPSHVLLAMGMSAEAAFECLRFSVGRAVTETDVVRAADEIAVAVKRVRQLSGTGTIAGAGAR